MVSATEPAGLELGDHRAFQDSNSLNSQRDQIMLFLQNGTPTHGVRTMVPRISIHGVWQKDPPWTFQTGLCKRATCRGQWHPGWVGFPLKSNFVILTAVTCHSLVWEPKLLYGLLTSHSRESCFWWSHHSLTPSIQHPHPPAGDSGLNISFSCPQ